MEQYILEELSRESEEEMSIKSGELLNRKIYSSGESFVVSEARLFGKSGRISARTHTRYTDFPLHRHNFVEMMIVLSGNITQKIEGECLTLSKGEILIMNKHVSHSIERSGENDIGVNVIISDGFIDTLAPELSGTVFSSLIKENRKKDGSPIYLCFGSSGRKYISNVIENLLFELISNEPKITVMTKTVSLLLHYLSIENKELLLHGSISADKEESRKIEIISYVKSNYATASLEELSERLYLTPPYLSKIVKEYFDKSFKEMVVEERMLTAMKMLTQGQTPVGDIIRSVGYENESYFHKEFKRRFGKTPLAIRKERK